MMRTIVTFAECRRSQPLILGTSWTQFDLLFTLHDDQVRLRQTWQPSVDAADYVLTVQRNPDHNAEWFIYTHQHSPLPRTKAALTCCKLEMEGWLDENDYSVEAGEVYSFGLSPKWLDHEVRMMITNEESSQPRVPRDVKPWEKLPRSVLGSIFEYLPGSTVMSWVPFISTAFFNFVKKDTGLWKTLDFRTDVVCMRDLPSLCSAAKKNCTAIYMMDYHDYCMRWNSDRAKDVYKFILLECEWPEVKKLYINGEMNKLKIDWVREALATGKFPALQELICSLKSERSTCTFDDFEDVQLPSLKHFALKTECGSRYRNGDDLVRGHEIWRNLPGLRSIHLRLSIEGALWEGLFNDGEDSPSPLTDLQDLKIIASVLAADLQNELKCLAGPSLKRLMLGGNQRVFDEEGSDPNYLWNPDHVQGKILEYFPNLETLCLRGEVCMGFKGVPGAVLENLKVFRGFLHKPKCVPFSKMMNLEAVSLDMWLCDPRSDSEDEDDWESIDERSDDEGQQHEDGGVGEEVEDGGIGDDNDAESEENEDKELSREEKYQRTIQTVFTLPKLQALVLSGDVLDFLGENDNNLPTCQNSTVAYLEVQTSDVRSEFCEILKKVLVCLPKINRLKVAAKEYLTSPKNLADVVKVKGKNVVELEVNCLRKVRSPGHFERQIDVLRNGLRGSWIMTRMPKSFSEEVVVFRRTGAPKLPQTCYVFDDVFFDVYNLA